MAHIESISLEDNFAFISQYRLCETQWRRVADFSDLTRRRRTRTGWDGYRVHYKIRETRLPSRRRSHLARRKEGGYLNDVCPKKWSPSCNCSTHGTTLLSCLGCPPPSMRMSYKYPPKDEAAQIAIARRGRRVSGRWL